MQQTQTDVSKPSPASADQYGPQENGGFVQPPCSSSTPVDKTAHWQGVKHGSTPSSTPSFGFANVKEEPMDDGRHDSGVSCGAPSISPASDRSSTNTTSPPLPQDQFYHPPADKVSLPCPAWYPESPEGANEERHTNSTSPPIAPQNQGNPNDFAEFRNPKVNSHGRMKVHKCKQCDFFSYTKMEFWAHSGMHIKGDKILKCPQCPFVTEYKHHLEYHLLNHAGAKPFKCPHCEYSCVNKSMLNSHLKSHSKVYQYRCANCNYETKYCHSLKLHLRKYDHSPDVVLHPDGTPNPYPVIDVYGTRRGPKVKRPSQPELKPAAVGNPNTEVQQQMPQPAMPPMMNPLLGAQPGMLPFPMLLPGFPAVGPVDMVMNLQNLFRERLEQLAQQNMVANQPEPVAEDGALDLTNKSNRTSERGDSENEEERMTTVFSNVEVVENKPEIKIEDVPSSSKSDFACQSCGICFGDEVMYRIHMGYHGYNSPFTCNMCGEECGNKVNFYLHIAKVAH